MQDAENADGLCIVQDASFERCVSMSITAESRDLMLTCCLPVMRDMRLMWEDIDDKTSPRSISAVYRLSEFPWCYGVVVFARSLASGWAQCMSAATSRWHTICLIFAIASNQSNRRAALRCALLRYPYVSVPWLHVHTFIGSVPSEKLPGSPPVAACASATAAWL